MILRGHGVGRRSAGFTLIELMVVLVIIGIMITMATLSLGDGGAARRVQSEAERLSALISLAGDEAVLNGRELGLLVDSDGYQFLLYNGSGWDPVADDPVLRKREWPKGMAIELLLEGLPVSLKVVDKKDQVPQVILSSSGERTPFELDVGISDGLGVDSNGPIYRIDAGPLGDLKLALASDKAG